MWNISTAMLDTERIDRYNAGASTRQAGGVQSKRRGGQQLNEQERKNCLHVLMSIQ